MNHYRITRQSDGTILSAYFAEAPTTPDPDWGGPGAFIVEDLGAVDLDFALWLCRDYRVKEYPSLGDQLDAVYKRDHLDEPGQWQAIAAKIDAVKVKYPKPTPPAEPS